MFLNTLLQDGSGGIMDIIEVITEFDMEEGHPIYTIIKILVTFGVCELTLTFLSWDHDEAGGFSNFLCYLSTTITGIVLGFTISYFLDKSIVRLCDSIMSVPLILYISIGVLVLFFLFFCYKLFISVIIALVLFWIAYSAEIILGLIVPSLDIEGVIVDIALKLPLAVSCIIVVLAWTVINIIADKLSELINGGR